MQAPPCSGSIAIEHTPIAPQSETHNEQAHCRNILSVASSSGTLRGGGRRPRETNRGDADSDSIGDRLCNGDYVALENFLPGHVRYRNTCWLAAVVNLCPVLPVIADVLGLRDRSWKETIHHARELWHEKYSYSEEHDGQHDAAEFLGDVLWEQPSFGFMTRRVSTIYNCCGQGEHHWEKCMAMI